MGRHRRNRRGVTADGAADAPDGLLLSSDPPGGGPHHMANPHTHTHEHTRAIGARPHAGGRG